MGDDIKRIIKTDERKDVQSGHILDGIFVSDTFGQSLIATDFITQLTNPTKEVRMRCFESSTADRITGIQNSSVHQHNTCRQHHLIAIGMSTAIHSRSIVHHNTTHHGTLNAGRIGSKLTTEWSQQFIHSLSDNTWLKSDLLMVIRNAVFFPILSSNNQNGVTNGLS